MVEHGLNMVISWSTMFLKHGRPCLKHGQPCFDRVHFTGVELQLIVPSPKQATSKITIYKCRTIVGFYNN